MKLRKLRPLIGSFCICSCLTTVDTAVWAASTTGVSATTVMPSSAVASFHREIEPRRLTEEQHDSVTPQAREAASIEADRVEAGGQGQRAEPAVRVGLDRAGDIRLGVDDGGDGVGEDAAGLVRHEALEVGPGHSGLRGAGGRRAEYDQGECEHDWAHRRAR